MFKNDPTLSVDDLVKLFTEAAITPADCAHLGVDIQECYAIKKIAAHIAEKITPEFRKAGIANYWIHYSDFIDKNGLPTGLYTFSKISPILGEKVIEKNKSSAIKGSDIDEHLKNKKI